MRTRRVAGLRRAGPSAALDKMRMYELVGNLLDGITARGFITITLSGTREQS